MKRKSEMSVCAEVYSSNHYYKGNSDFKAFKAGWVAAVKYLKNKQKKSGKNESKVKEDK